MLNRTFSGRTAAVAALFFAVAFSTAPDHAWAQG